MTAGFNALLGVRCLGMRNDEYWIELEADERHLHDMGTVHGGVILSLLDIAMSRAVRATLEPRSYMPTIELSASFLRPLEKGRISVSGKVLVGSKRLSRVEGRLFDSADRTSAIGRATFMRPE